MSEPMQTSYPVSILALALLLAACSRGGEAAAREGDSSASTATTAASAEATPALKRDSVLPAGFARVSFDVQGMTCGGCVIGTRRALRKLAGVSAADAAYDEKTKQGTAWAVYDPARVTPAQMMAAIRGLGYVATPDRG